QSALQDKTREMDDLIKRETSRLSDAMLEKTADYLMAVWRLERQRQTEPTTTVKEIAQAEGVHEVFLKRWMDYASRPAREQLPQLIKWNELRVGSDGGSNAWEEKQRKARAAAEAFQNYIASIVKLRRAMEAHQS